MDKTRSLNDITAALAQYDIVEELGSGAMGVVYAGVHRSLGRQVAIKQLSVAFAGDEQARRRFQREAKILARLDHPHIVPIYDFVDTETTGALVMERLTGGSVADAPMRRSMKCAEACAIGLTMLAGLHAAHLCDVLHLDVKPANLLFTEKGTLKVADFGISKVMTADATVITSDGRVFGTPAYIAPEQALGKALSAATDVYAAGTVLYLLLTGRLPYSSEEGQNPLTVIHRHVAEDPEPITPARDPQVSPALARVVMRAIERDPAARHGSAEEFAVELARAAAHVFGADWLEKSRVRAHLTPRVMGAATTNNHRPTLAMSSPLPPVHPPTAMMPVSGSGAGQASAPPAHAPHPVPTHTPPTPPVTPPAHPASAGPLPPYVPATPPPYVPPPQSYQRPYPSYVPPPPKPSLFVVLVRFVLRLLGRRRRY